MRRAAALCALMALASGALIEMEPRAPAERAHAKRGWTAVEPSPDGVSLRLVIAVRQQRLQELEETVLRVSDPRSPAYGKHLSNEEVHQLVAPKPAHAAAVRAWLAQHGVEGNALSPNGDLVEAVVPVRLAEQMLSAQYHSMQHTSGAVAHRCSSYHLPEEVAAAVDFVSPTVHLPARNRPLRRNPLGSPDALENSPKVLRKLYSVGDAVGQAPANRMAVTAFLDQHYHAADLKEFWKLFCGGLTCGKGEPVLKGDETTGASAGTEAMLDIQTITGVAGNVSSEFWGFKGRDPGNKENEPFMSWLSLLSSTPDASVPKIFSTSYGEDESSWSLEAATRMNTEFQKAGARGITLLYASGDEGANCKTVDGKRQFAPETPSSSPWVTAVGGTGGGAASGESAAGLSSGGFSNYWKQPTWQQTAVSNYLKTASNLPAATMGYNTSGRAYPDIAAQAEGFTVVVDLIPLPGVAGTSCASPTAAGVIALLNDLRLQQGKCTLGFLNPLVYQNAADWNDITKGVSNSESCGGGWPASAGWDAATGVGTPNYQKLAAILSKLP